jgi:Na+/melibiose symporter-like transporter
MMKEAVLMKRMVLLILGCCSIILMTGFMFWYLIKGDNSRWQVAAGGIAVSALPLLLLKLKSNPFNIPIIVGYYLFILLSAVLGSIASFYLRYLWWDSALHFYKGFFIACAGIVLYKQLIPETARKAASKWLLPLFVLSISVTASVIWEIYEFLGDQTFTHTMQRGGNTDTMIDLICGTAGGLVITIYTLVKKAV